MLALVTARAARALDEDLPPLCAALDAAGIAYAVVDWDDPGVSWSSFETVLIRSTWDYIDRLDEFLRWAAEVAAASVLLNPLDVIRWNTHKAYLLELQRHAIPIVPTRLLRAGDGLDLPASGEWVIKPAVGAGSRGARRFCDDPAGARDHAQALLREGRDVLVQPYLARVDAAGETSLMYFAGQYSHAIRKGPLLPANAQATELLFAPEAISPREPGADERALADRIVAMLPFAQTPLYARVDLLRDADGAPVLLELELTEPSLFFTTAAGSAERFVAALQSLRAPRVE